MADLIKVTDIEFPTIKDRSDHVTFLITGRQNIDPKLFEAITILNDQISRITLAISPIVKALSQRSVSAILLIPPTDFGYSIERVSIRLFWTRPEIDGVINYELRFGGADWETADFVLRTQSTQVNVVPFIGLIGLYRVKTMNDLGQYSAEEASVTVIVTAPAAPTLSARTIDNNVLLSWNIPVSDFSISYYNLWKNKGLIGIVRGNFTTYFEMVGGTYLYGISAVDVAGNESTLSEIPVTLAIPPDFVLESIYVSNLGALDTQAHGIYIEKAGSVNVVNFIFENQSGFTTDPTHIYLALIQTTSTLVNCIRTPGPKLLACWLITNWQQHFTNHSWSSPKNQVDAGYPIYIQPGALTGSYEEVVNYGAVFPNVIATISWSTQVVTSENISVIVKMAASTDGVTYSPMIAGASQFFDQIRFLKFRLEFTAESDHALAEFFNVTVSLNVKKELDSGFVTANAGDIAGTTVLFNKKFKDVESITLTVEAKEPVTAIYDFNDIANPTFFKLFALDSAGNRVTYPVSWKARGIV